MIERPRFVQTMRSHQRVITFEKKSQQTRPKWSLVAREVFIHSTYIHMLCTNNRSEKSRGLSASILKRLTIYYRLTGAANCTRQTFRKILQSRNVNTTCLLNVDVYATLQLSVVDISLPEKKNKRNNQQEFKQIVIRLYP